MSKGWVYTGCEDTYPGGRNASEDGDEGSIQFRNGTITVTGSNTLTFSTASATHQLRLTGTLEVSGAINATSYNVRSIDAIYSIGSTRFGDTSDDSHIFTGSVILDGSLSGSTANFTTLSASFMSMVPITGTIAGAGSLLGLDTNNKVVVTTSPAGAVTAINNATANELVTIGSTTTELDAEANLTFDGAVLKVTGDISGSKKLQLGERIEALGDLGVTGSAVIRNTLTLGSDRPHQRHYITGSTYFSGSVEISGNAFPGLNECLTIRGVPSGSSRPRVQFITSGSIPLWSVGCNNENFGTHFKTIGGFISNPGMDGYFSINVHKGRNGGTIENLLNRNAVASDSESRIGLGIETLAMNESGNVRIAYYNTVPSTVAVQDYYRLFLQDPNGDNTRGVLYMSSSATVNGFKPIIVEQGNRRHLVPGTNNLEGPIFFVSASAYTFMSGAIVGDTEYNNDSSLTHAFIVHGDISGSGKYHNGGGIDTLGSVGVTGSATIRGTLSGTTAQFTTLSASFMSMVPTTGSAAGPASYLALDPNNRIVVDTVTPGPVTALNNQAQSRLVTIGSTTTELDGEANLTFDGSRLAITGSSFLTGSTQHSGSWYTPSVTVGAGPHNTILNGTASINATTSNVFTFTLTGSMHLANPSGLSNGASYNFILKQDGTGGRTLTYGNKYKFPGAVIPAVSNGANDVDILSAISDGTNLYCTLTKDFS